MNLETKIIIYKFTPQVFTLTRFYSEADGWEKHYPFGTSWEGGHVAVYRELVWGMP